MARTSPETAKRKNGPVHVTPPTPTPASVPAETGQETFRRIATGRVNQILEKLNTLSKLASGKSRYGYTDEEVEHVRKNLIKGVNAACDRLRRKPLTKGSFSFDPKGEDAGA